MKNFSTPPHLSVLYHEIINNLSSFYKEKMERIGKNEGVECAERALKEPLKELLRFQASFLDNYKKFKEL